MNAVTHDDHSTCSAAIANGIVRAYG